MALNPKKLIGSVAVFQALAATAKTDEDYGNVPSFDAERPFGNSSRTVVACDVLDVLEAAGCDSGLTKTEVYDDASDIREPAIATLLDYLAEDGVEILRALAKVPTADLAALIKTDLDELHLDALADINTRPSTKVTIDITESPEARALLGEVSLMEGVEYGDLTTRLPLDLLTTSQVVQIRDTVFNQGNIILTHPTRGALRMRNITSVVTALDSVTITASQAMRTTW